MGKENIEKNVWVNIRKSLLENKNKKIYNKFKCADIITVSEVCRLEWLGHVVGVDEEWTVRKLVEGKPEGGR